MSGNSWTTPAALAQHPRLVEILDACERGAIFAVPSQVAAHGGWVIEQGSLVAWLFATSRPIPAPEPEASSPIEPSEPEASPQIEASEPEASTSPIDTCEPVTVAPDQAELEMRARIRERAAERARARKPTHDSATELLGPAVAHMLGHDRKRLAELDDALRPRLEIRGGKTWRVYSRAIVEAYVAQVPR